MLLLQDNMQEWWSKLCTHWLTKGKSPAQWYPEDRIAHPKWTRAHSRISRRNNHSPQEAEGTQFQEDSMGDNSTHRDCLRSEVHCSVKNQLSQRDSGGCPFYSLVRSELRSFMVSAPEVSLSWGTSLAGTLPADQGLPPCPFPPWGNVHDQGHGVPARVWWSALTRGTHASTAMAECQRHESKGAKQPAAVMLKSAWTLLGGCTCHSA